MPKTASHKWTFKARFRRHAFGWKSQPAIKRIKEAVSEIKKVARKEPVLGAEGAIAFLERLSPAIEAVDSSSGSIGSAVNTAIEQLVPIIAQAPIDTAARLRWLERLFAAIQDDQIPYIESLADHWGELCVDPEMASSQADLLLEGTREALKPNQAEFFEGSSACLSALYAAGRFAEIMELTGYDRLIWPYKQWAVKALTAQGKKAKAIRLAESCRGWTPDQTIDQTCEAILLSSGMSEEAYLRYGLSANRASTHLATFRAVAKRYPNKPPTDLLEDLVRTTPGEEGKWFAAAKSVGLYGPAIALAEKSPCDPRTLTRAAKDFATKEPEFAYQAGLLALHWLVQGHGYDISNLDVRAAYYETMKAAEQLGKADEAHDRIQALVSAETAGDRFVSRALKPILNRA